MDLFKKATREAVKLRMAITGPSGSGKTYSALTIARGLVGPKGRIALADTENKSASLYSDRFEFDTAQMNPPYLIAKYVQVIQAAASAGFDCIIIDSLSHAWAGEGGILQKKEAMDSRGGNSFTNWGKLTPEQNALVNAVLHSQIHIICTMRSKTEYIVQENEKGKAAPRKVGMAPVQREGFEYEFDVCLDMSLDHSAAASKDRSGLFDGKFFTPTIAVGEEIANWLKIERGVPLLDPSPIQPLAQEPKASVDTAIEPEIKAPLGSPSFSQLKRLFTIAGSSGWTNDHVHDFILRKLNKDSTKDLTQDEYGKLCDYIAANKILDTRQRAAGESAL